MSTNYYNTLIEIADDSPTATSVSPNLTKPSVASQQFEMISRNPYTYTSDDVIFARVAEKESIAEDDMEAARRAYFEKAVPVYALLPWPNRMAGAFTRMKKANWRSWPQNPTTTGDSSTTTR